jgi:hypothetical protein
MIITKLMRLQALTVTNMKMTAFCNIAPCSPGVYRRFIALMMEAVRTSETSVYFNETTWRYIPEGYHIYYNT